MPLWVYIYHPCNARHGKARTKAEFLVDNLPFVPAWLDNAHRALDGAVADAYGWGEDWAAGRLDEDEILARLFRLNQARAAAEAAS